MRTLVKALAVLAVTVVGCKSSSTTSSPTQASSTTTASIQGALALDSFKSAPTQVYATDEAGVRTSAVLAADGAFTLSVTGKHTYTLSVVTAKGEEPIVYPRTGRIARSFRLGTAATSIALGKVQHFESAPTTGFAADGETNDDGKQEDGTADGETADDGTSNSAGTCDQNDGEDADATQPMAVPAANPPADACVDAPDQPDQPDNGDGETKD